MSELLIPELWNIVTGYLDEPDVIKLYAFGVRSPITHGVIPFELRDLKENKQTVNGYKHSEKYIILGSDDQACEYRISNSASVDTRRMNFRIATSAKTLQISFPDVAIDGITIVSDTLEHLIVSAGSLTSLSYHTKTDTLHTLRIFGVYSNRRPFLLDGFEDIKCLYLLSHPESKGNIKFRNRTLLSTEMKLIEYYGDVSINLGIFPDLEFCLMFNRTKFTSIEFPKLQVFVNGSEVRTRK